jgi:hypothetical protein
MAYDEKLAGRIRETLAHVPDQEEKKMFRGITFMVNGKMCVCVSNDELMCRFDPYLTEEVSKKKGFRKMIMNGREYKGYGYISPEGIRLKKDFDYWIGLALEFNERAKSSKKKK